MTLEEVKNAKIGQAEKDKIIRHIEDVADAEYFGKMGNPLKTFDKMWQVITDKARVKEVNGCACIDDDTVYAWVDEYVGREEKAEEPAKTEQKPAAKTDDAPNKEEKPLYHNAKQQHKGKKLIKLEDTPAADEPAEAENKEVESKQKEKTAAKTEAYQITFDF